MTGDVKVNVVLMDTIDMAKKFDLTYMTISYGGKITSGKKITVEAENYKEAVLKVIEKTKGRSFNLRGSEDGKGSTS